MKARRGMPPAERARTDASRIGVHWMLVFGVVLAVAFIEVWESTAVSQLSLEIEQLEVELREADARQSLLDARAAESGSRVRLASHAKRLGLRPADPNQVVVIPREYVGTEPANAGPEHGLAAVTRRASEILVPAARARERRQTSDSAR